MSRRPIEGGFASIAALVLWLLSFSAAIAAEQDTSALQSVPGQIASTAIPLPEIASRAAEVTNILHTMKVRLPQPQHVQQIETKLGDLRRDNDGEVSATTAMLGGAPTLESIQAKQKFWQGRQLQTSRWLKVLTERAVLLKNELDRLGQLRKIWAATREAAQASNAPGPVLQQVDAVIGSIDAARISVEASHGSVLDLQSAVATEVARCESEMNALTQAQEMAVSDLLTPHGLPLWSRALWEEARRSLPGSVRGVMAASWGEIRQYVQSFARIMVLHAILFLGVALSFQAIGRRTRRWTGIAEYVSSCVVVFDFPWSAAYIVSLLFTTGPYSPAPPAVQRVFTLAALLPMIRMIAPLGPQAVFWGYVTAGLFVLECIRQTVAGAPLIEQAFLVAEMAAGASVLVWAYTKGYKATPVRADWTVRERLVRFGGTLFLLGFPIGLIAGTLGYLRLARLLGNTLLGIGVLVLLLTCCLRILTGLLAFSFRVWPLRCLRLVENHRDLLVTRTQRVLFWLTICAGLSRSLDHLGLLQPTLDIIGAALSAKLERGSISISPGDVLVFLLTVWLAYILSAFIRFVLEEDVYPRLQIPIGLSYAASSLLNYVILALGVVAGMAAVGVDLTRVTVMAGALGVGIGFGLQSVVNNFVSGLILLFERPIHVGDNIEVGNLTGEVRRIGIRASTIRTRQGAEIIIPNAQLVTDKVTNWTLSDQLRRIDVPVGVNYGAVPKDVIRLLERVARAHPRVLNHPPPHGLFVGFGDSSIDFELRAWTDEFSDWAHVRSDLTVSIHDAVVDAGWAFPFPQREVRIIDKPTP